MNKLTLRSGYFLVFVCCAALLGFAVYMQHRMFLDPCPLCIFQRICFAWIGLFALIALIHNPSGTRGRWIYCGTIVLGSLAGLLVAGRHVYLQSLPPDQVPACGPGLNYMLETLPFSDVLKTVLFGSGSCAEVQWTFLGMSMPHWTLLWFVLLGIGTWWMTRRLVRRSAAS